MSVGEWETIQRRVSARPGIRRRVARPFAHLPRIGTMILAGLLTTGSFSELEAKTTSSRPAKSAPSEELVAKSPRTPQPRTPDSRTSKSDVAKPMSPSDSQIQWVSLVPQDAPTWLENKNLIESLCGTNARPAPQDPAACRREKLQPKIWRLPLYASPRSDEGSATLGEIRVQATPGMGLVFSYLNTKGQSLGFKPDLFDADWSYGPYGHQSVRGRDGDWIKLPRRPFPQDVWVNIQRDWQERPELIEALSRGGVWTADLGGTPHEFVLLEIAGLDAKTAMLRSRDPDPRDLPCGEEEDPDFPRPDAPYPASRTLPLRDFIDRDGHWKLRIAHMRGC